MRANQHILTNENYPFGAFIWKLNSKLFFCVFPVLPELEMVD